MNLKTIVPLFCCCFLCYLAQGQDTIQVIARLLAPGEGSKVHIAKYEVLKVLQGPNLNTHKIEVGYYFYKAAKNLPDTVLLTLFKYTGKHAAPNYYIFPNYDAQKGTEEITIFNVYSDYWESCENGQQPCPTIFFSKKSKTKKCFLFMLCGGTSTTVSLSKAGELEPLKREIVPAFDCPPVLDISDLEDGIYDAYMLSRGWGAGIRFELKTK